VYLDGSGWILEFRDSVVHLNSRVLTSLPKFIIPCKLRRIRVLECA